jgi:hypothetical protein
MKEVRILLTEETFTLLCKQGYVAYKNNMFSVSQINITKADLEKLISGDIIDKPQDGVDFKIALMDIGYDRILPIIKRSPFYGNSI